MCTTRAVVFLLGMGIAAVPFAAGAQATKVGFATTTTVPVASAKGPMTPAALIAHYTPFAGSAENAAALVHGLRNGSEIVLTGATPGETCPPVILVVPLLPLEPVPCVPGSGSVSFVPLTGTTGWGNVDVAMAFAQAQLTELGITTPTPEQIKAAFVGGTVQPGTTLVGVLTLRAGGMGWGEIAHQFGYKLQ